MKAHHIFLSACLVLASPMALAGDIGPAQSSLERFSAGLESLHARFSQRVITQDGVVENEGEGEVWLQTPGLFRWASEGDYPELIVADGQYIWMYDEMLEQVTVKPQSDEAENSPLLLLTDPAGLEEQFTITEAGQHEGVDLLTLQSSNPESEFDRVLLGFDQDQLVLMGLEDAFGMRTEIRFSELVRNLPLDPGLFRFEPPPGTDVVGETPDRPDA